jgi:Putative quorum-sensing-regulated virulence factor
VSADPLRMPFGRFKGQPLTALPDHYLTWLCSLELREPLRSAVADEVRRRQVPAALPPLPPDAMPWAESIVALGVRRLARRHHPDIAGGASTLTMQRINLAAQWLRAVLGRGVMP